MEVWGRGPESRHLLAGWSARLSMRCHYYYTARTLTPLYLVNILAGHQFGAFLAGHQFGTIYIASAVD